jgi:hypothetical protein
LERETRIREFPVPVPTRTNVTTTIQNVYLHVYGISYNMDVIKIDEAQVMSTIVMAIIFTDSYFRFLSNSSRQEHRMWVIYTCYMAKYISP